MASWIAASKWLFSFTGLLDDIYILNYLHVRTQTHSDPGHHVSHKVSMLTWTNFNNHSTDASQSLWSVSTTGGNWRFWSREALVGSVLKLHWCQPPPTSRQPTLCWSHALFSVQCIWIFLHTGIMKQCWNWINWSDWKAETLVHVWANSRRIFWREKWLNPPNLSNSLSYSSRYLPKQQ